MNVCVDCLFFIANGDLPEDAERAAEVRSIGLDWVITEDDEGHFSWSPCDACGSRLGGQRFAAERLAD